MNKTIHIREAVTPEEVERFWQELHAYHARDIFPDPAEEDRAYFLDDSQYRATVQRIHDREGDRCYYLLFRWEGRDIGFALTALYPSEDGKCFVMEFCVLPEFRGGGTGTACARLLLDWAADRGAQYGELNAADPRRIRFWSRLGFRPNGRDEWGEPLMLRPPEQVLPITVELLRDPADWQLRKLENGYLAEIGEPLLTEESTERLRAAVEQGHIRFLLAYRGCRAVGMCSVAENFSTFCCGPAAVLEDLYVEPVFRRQGIARQLTRSAQALCRERGVGSLTVCCAPCDEAMYQALGFNVPLGVSRSCLL